jgi:hypothetical protein
MMCIYLSKGGGKMDYTYEALSPAQQQDMDFAGALDVLIATAITCLRNDNRKLRRAVEIAINYRELSPTTPPAISLQHLELLGAWLSPKPTGRGFLGVGASLNKGGCRERLHHV